MPPHLDDIVSAFDRRAASYARNEWHRRCAERLVHLCGIEPGRRVLDAATGTGFAAIAAARAVGPAGHVVGIDISPGMLRQARVAVEVAGLTNVELIESNAVELPQCPDFAFDVVVCSCGLLYMPAGEALREWHRVLKPGGRLAFSLMQAGSPPAGRIFRECAAAFGVTLTDPSEPLGSPSACRRLLEAAGFEVVEVVSEIIEFSAQDLSLAWESNFGSASNAGVRRLDLDRQKALKQQYLAALEGEERRDRDALRRAGILYAIARR